MSERKLCWTQSFPEHLPEILRSHSAQVGAQDGLSTPWSASSHHRTSLVSSLLAEAQPAFQWFSRDFLQLISEKSEALCLVLKDCHCLLPLEGSGGVRVGEMSEFSKPIQGTAHATGFFMAVNGFSSLTLGLFNYTQCCADKPVWEKDL